MASIPVQAPIVRSPIRWVGGKRWLVRTLIEDYLASDEPYRYIAPFFGGGALFWNLAARGLISEAVINDVNPVLVSAWRNLRDHPEDIIDGLRRHAEQHSADHYYEQRERFNTLIQPPMPGGLFGKAGAEHSTIEASVLFFYLNSTGYNGLYRTNKAGAFNVAMDPGRKPRHVMDDARAEHFRASSAALRDNNVRILRDDFAVAVATAADGDRLYADSPYAGTYDRYTADRFTSHDQRRLRHILNGAVVRGVHVLASNSNHPSVTQLYSGWTRREVSRRGTVSAGADRSAVTELLMSHPTTFGAAA